MRLSPTFVAFLAIPFSALATTNVNCTSAQEGAIEGAIPVANKYITAGHSYFVNEGLITQPGLYVNWFGARDPERERIVAAKFKEMAESNGLASLNYICGNETAPACEQNRLIYVPTNDSQSAVYLCDRFFTAPTSGYKSQGSTLVHATTFVPDDAAQGVDGPANCLDLANSSPDQAVKNPGNYEFFSVDALDRKGGILGL